ncbi:dihydrodipicolinate synthase family protein [Microvirga subterranea]|uniref:4-hydroxy-tetrahydrodipicolinate synthase n=1 Tax=Microvirga subterranea TaxID=186651 RepID=A0A370HH77_9HYPH|nr:dihydrodipicolinate synthase family protein [Microvirga subterranea]RDI56807.1 4-hydroxy-tetrahydrodipicolinate synthase [Microvirga subterranea]
MAKADFAGVLVPAITSFQADLEVDAPLFLGVCRWLLAQGANGLAVFGTTSEANSLSIAERRHLLEHLVEGGIDPSLLLPGTGQSALPDAVELTRHAVSVGCGGVLMLPPFYYKPISVEGLFAFYSEVIERVGSSDLGLWLYHIPQMTGVGIPHDLIERLIKRYPDTVLGIKDSSGDWSNTEAMLTRFPGFRIFPSSEGVLLKAMRLGAAGCITASGNINAAAIRQLVDNWKSPDADALQEPVADVRNIFSSYPLIPAAKAVMATLLREPGLAQLRPPLTPLSDTQSSELIARLEKAGHAFKPAPFM